MIMTDIPFPHMGRVLLKELEEVETMLGTKIDVRAIEIADNINGSTVGEEDDINTSGVRGVQWWKSSSNIKGLV